MAIAVSHQFVSAVADGADTSLVRPSDWNASHSLTGLTTGRLIYGGSATELTDSANLTYSEASGPRLTVGSGSGTSAGLSLGYSGTSGYAWLGLAGLTPSLSNYALLAGPNGADTYLGAAGTGGSVTIQINGTTKFQQFATAGRGPDFTMGTATTDVGLRATQTWNASGVTFTGWKFTITDTASASGSLAMQILGGAAGTTNLFKVDKAGTGTFVDCVTTGYFSTAGGYKFTGFGNPCWLQLLGDGFWRFGNQALDKFFGLGIAADNSIQFSSAGAAAGASTSRTCINKAVTAIADNTATTVFTVTVPNAAHSASIRVRLTGSSGAGGAVGANEATQDAEYMVNVTRTAGVNAVATIGAVVGQAASATVAGGNGVAVTGTLGAITGAVGASNTFTIQVTIARAAGTATNHTCLAFAELLNANATGVTIA